MKKTSKKLPIYYLKYNLIISTKKTKVTDFKGKRSVRSYIVIHDKRIEQENILIIISIFGTKDLESNRNGIS
jgi:hypothetical protein